MDDAVTFITFVINPAVFLAYDFIIDISSGTKFYRTRKAEKSLMPIVDIEPYSQMGSPPAVYAKTNRMSPAGIPYLYLASDRETTMKECRINSGEDMDR
ncbi:MAG: RES family NAD+ phosphorylase [Lachnospiraceae bacterium]|nr:RES family NAD+ phosphorylase [Lachnospiraceae bacterium]